ncbi:MAG: hypothetical protein FWD76_05790 [Firmicutes bacterium]|nr:hypothetical protein [Bacillota bacterium]
MIKKFQDKKAHSFWWLVCFNIIFDIMYFALPLCIYFLDFQFGVATDSGVVIKGGVGLLELFLILLWFVLLIWSGFSSRLIGVDRGKILRAWGCVSINFKVIFVFVMLVVAGISQSETVIFWVYVCGIAWMILFEVTNILRCQDKKMLVVVDWTGLYHKGKEIEFLEKFATLDSHKGDNHTSDLPIEKVENDAQQSLVNLAQRNTKQEIQLPNKSINSVIFAQITLGALFALVANPRVIENKSASMVVFVLLGSLYAISNFYLFAKVVWRKGSNQRMVGIFVLMMAGVGALVFEYLRVPRMVYFSMIRYMVWVICDCFMLYLLRSGRV